MALPVRPPESKLRNEKQDNLVGGPGPSRTSARGINFLEVMAMVMTAFLMIDTGGDRPRRKGEAVRMRADNDRALRAGPGKALTLWLDWISETVFANQNLKF